VECGERRVTARLPWAGEEGTVCEKVFVTAVQKRAGRKDKKANRPEEKSCPRKALASASIGEKRGGDKESQSKGET